jgi:diguanylate cyclase (GGDEF)-like protein
LSEFRPNLVLMDMQMGRYSGATLARMIRFDPEWLGLPIVYLSSEENRERQLEALSHGGDDFLTKPVSDHYLQRAVLVRCYRARQLEKLATRDSLTGLLKHSLANAEIENEFARSVRAGQESVVAMLDLDHFKRVNDRYGHRAGDMVIKGLANLLRHRLRKSDILGRYGGEEFIVALVDCALDDARAVMASVCERLSRIVFNAGDQEFSVTVSIGLARMNDYPTVEAAIEAADKALYERKHSGRNGVSLAPDSNLGRTG